MDIRSILPYIAECCIYYYKRYQEITHRECHEITSHIKDVLMQYIYEYYINIAGTVYVYDIYLMTEPYDKIFILDRDTISIGDMLAVIDDYIDKTKSLITLTSDINIVSLSKHPIENYIKIDYNWIRQIIDLYLY